MVDLVVIGGAGYLGRAVVREASSRHLTVVATRHTSTPVERGVEWETLDVRDHDDVARVIDRHRPRAIINAAYVISGPDLVTTTGLAPAAMARAARRIGSRFVHLSTDLVFDGTSPRPYVESDPPRPILEYGQVKLDSERAVMTTDADALVVRTSLLYGGVEPGPQETLVTWAAEGADIAFFVNELRSPVRVGELAAGLLDLSLTRRAVGLWHLAGDEPMNRLAFARRLALSMGIDPDLLRGGDIDESRGPRPRNCSLDSSLARHVLNRIDSPPFPG